jgi:hypothetical protein
MIKMNLKKFIKIMETDSMKIEEKFSKLEKKF